ncbi:MAG: AI-2E family transporter [Candidatus Sericytochromatia bacterium]|nr:AI-2E family transporter [Candidatus Sericytochromatia bacterium]
MDRKLFFTLFVALLLGAMLWQLYLIFEPFVNSLLWAGVLVSLSYPVYARLLARMPKRPEVAALLMCLGLTLGLVLPFLFLMVLLFQDLSEGARQLSHSAQNINFDTLRHHPILQQPWLVQIQEFLGRFVKVENLDFKNTAMNSLKGLSQFMLASSTDFFKALSGMVILLLLVEINLFFLFCDGKRFVDYLKSLIPIESQYKDLVLGRMREVVQASIFGSVGTACAQGLLGGLGFLVLGVPSAILWGVTMTVLSFLPLVGPPVVWAPAAAWLFFQGHPIKALILVLWGTLVVGTIDNILRPILISSVSSEDNRLNTLVLFLAVLGGLKVFGFLGIVLAPLMIVLTLTLIELVQIGLGYPQVKRLIVPEPALPAPPDPAPEG